MHESVTFEISADLLAALKLGAEDLGRNMRLIAAIAYFQDYKRSPGKAAKLADDKRFSLIFKSCWLLGGDFGHRGKFVPTPP
ncbi:UPF0175 family protein [Leptolyngbya iicbica]|uniref:Uncharacterized protein n=2 Tax=Cyanophyceae TaxID=3028117 RepID=A0A4Q7DZV7_9CYAN|nr:hypothetical protein DYY88_22265 [Leptolyngbya sp. LK]